jgi:uncharacterized protein (DUF2252 family)
MGLRSWVRLVGIVVALAIVASSRSATGVQTAPQAASASSWLRYDARSVPRELVLLLRQSSYDFFRAVNREWTSRVCGAFEGDRDALTPVRLQGDAHIEQYAVTDTAYGLDDFDDSSEGPAVIDLVRFIGSLNLAARDRGWQAQTDHIVGEFLQGYRRGLERSDYMPHTPALVQRLRHNPVRDRAAFLAWAEGLMIPVPASIARQAHQALSLLAEQAAKDRPDLSPTYFTVKKIGGFRLGIGSRRVPKLLVRVEGPSPRPSDDLILEAKQPADLTGVSCLEPEAESPAIRIITGARQIGRLHHEVLSLVPKMTRGGDSTRHWWIHDWMPSYQEVGIQTLWSASDLAELARDAGAQLGSASLPVSGPAAQETRKRQSKTIKRLDRRIREEARQLTNDMLAAWEVFRRQE